MSDLGVCSKIATEIRYTRGLTYFDRCGGLTQTLLDVLGPAFFIPSMPNQARTELHNGVERIALHFSPKSMGVVQTGPTTCARVEKVASTAWDLIEGRLEIGETSRFGVRITWLWSAPSLEAAQQRLVALGLTSPATPWLELFGKPRWAMIAAVSRDSRGGEARRELNVIQHQVEGAVPPDLAPFFPEIAVQFDVDYVHPPSNSLNESQIRTFVRDSWANFHVDLNKINDRFISLPETSAP